MRSSSSTDVPIVKAERKPEDGYSLREICTQLSCQWVDPLDTPNSTPESLETEVEMTLAFIHVFRDEQPDWPPKIYYWGDSLPLPRVEALPSMYIQ